MNNIIIGIKKDSLKIMIFFIMFVGLVKGHSGVTTLVFNIYDAVFFVKQKKM